MNKNKQTKQTKQTKQSELTDHCWNVCVHHLDAVQLLDLLVRHSLIAFVITTRRSLQTVANASIQ